MKSNITKNMLRNQDRVRLAYNLPEVAKALGISTQSVDGLIKSGDIVHFQAGSQVLVCPKMLLRFIEQRKHRPLIQNSREGEP
jgi:predicted DNA-binding transcriptional regulator AlpA